MSLSRRKFLKAGTLVAIAAGIPLKVLGAQTITQSSAFLPTNGRLNAGMGLSREVFARHLNTEFTFARNKSAGVSVKLIEVYDLTPKTAASGKECFGVVFAGPSNTPLRQDTYSVEHKSLEKFEMLVVPIASRKEGVYYEAIFNRLH